MREIGDIDASERSPYKEDEGFDENKPRTSASSSNSLADESEKTARSSGVRQYSRSKLPRLRWTPDLHLSFVQAVERLGGQERATPKLILQLMNIKGLSIAHIKSHLQMYRSKKIDNRGQVITSGGFQIGSEDGLQKFWQPSMLDQQIRSFRYSNVSSSGLGNWMPRSCVNDTKRIRARASLHGFLGEGFHGQTGNMSMGNQQYLWKDFAMLYGCESKHLITKQAPIEPSLISSQWNNGSQHEKYCFSNSVHHISDISWSSDRDRTRSSSKRKAQEINDLDLNLSLGMNSRQEEDSNLSLSLFSDHSKRESHSLELDLESELSNKLNNENKRMNPRWASTLNLTI
ncbi:myb family transcription factor PHL8-like isoform X2 [Diospyros lotus]|uniref:myb family transcription factor PHL8-like isoform X2 n=1 Tax=Diospyros lotus TaxID=55363 RepID=UPI002251F71B|nr:myb family transcription factor PHL8-like isoform X2 [Diospyros lotus]